MALRDVLIQFTAVVDQSQIVDAQKNVNKLIGQFNGLARAAKFALAALGIGKLTDSIDEYITLENKLKAVTSSTEEMVAAQKGVEQIADAVAVPVRDVADSFLRYTLATESLGASQEEVLDFTKRVTQAMILSGASSEEAHRAAVQLAQGFGKNFQAAAQDLKSVKEQAPVLARIIEKAAGALPGSLLVAAKEGKVSSKLVFDAVRAAGVDLDRDFAKRQKRFEDIASLLNNAWLRLIKQLKQVFVPVIDALESIVHWTNEWVKSGSATNAIIAALIVGVGALTVAFAPLIASVVAAVAPFALLFLLLDDLVTFLRGGDSILGRVFETIFGEGGADTARQWIQDVWTKLTDFFEWLGSPDRWAGTWSRLYDDMVKWIGAGVDWAKTKISELAAVITNQLRGALGDTVSNMLNLPQVTDEEASAAGAGLKKSGSSVKDFLLGGDGFLPDFGFDRLINSAFNTTRDAAFYERGRMLPAPSISLPTGAGLSGPVSAPVINNNITVAGNADAPVAREIANSAGKATAASLGRDRSAVGAAFGVRP